MVKYLFVFLLSHPSLCANKTRLSIMIFWNVGQGQWITAVTPDACLHYDFGGELMYWKDNKNLFLQLCRNKQNVLHLSHSDLDHYAYYSLFVKSISKICWAEIDHTNIPPKRLPQKVPLCTNILTKESQRLYNPDHFINRNDSSKIYRYKSVLIPGDSSKKQEKIWSKIIKNPENFKFMSLGHHGSRTSNSDFLLATFSNLKMAFVQSRKKKFSHPHVETVQKLKNHRIPLVKIEDWGTTAILF